MAGRVYPAQGQIDGASLSQTKRNGGDQCLGIWHDGLMEDSGW
jgi:hypothetical protein